MQGEKTEEISIDNCTVLLDNETLAQYFVALKEKLEGKKDIKVEIYFEDFNSTEIVQVTEVT